MSAGPTEAWTAGNAGQLALRDCLRQAYNGGSPRGGTCTMAGTGLNGNGEPRMTLN